MTLQLDPEPVTVTGTSRFPLHGQTALVSGAATGIGAAIAHALAEAGAAVAVNHHGQARGAGQVLTGIQAQGGHAAGYDADLRDARAIATMHARASDELGDIDILINNAGDYPRIP